MKILKKMMQAGLTVIFFGLLATNTVFADNSEGWQFVQENGRTYYKKGDLKETYWRVIDGKYYYFDSLSGEMVVGWQYIPFPSKGSTIGPYPNGIRLEGFPKSEWYYFDKNGVLQEFVGWRTLEIKTKDSVGRKYGEKREDSEDKEEKRYYTNYYFNQNHSLETGWLYDQSNWYYLAKTEINGENYIGGERRAGWINDASAWYYLRSSGAMATGWYQEGTTWYYLDHPNGDMKTGWQNLGNKWYYLRSSGAMATGWYQDGSTWYYLNAGNGDMKTGWFQVNGNWYYAYSSGALAVNTTVDGYSVNYNGEWVR
ncbi:choline-binding protein CbpJ [Streptococcus pneumoniae]|uniref:choline-binding protein CbpJ n=1 Tax=Streptococcus pneumoniae TaxID=1313 RepID=UPI000B58A7F5|nr:choline-binding protein CbpJ [Streptococcus pneumoniae]SND14552.1 choline binding protein J [Streptococcus pneumoniae]